MTSKEAFEIIFYYFWTRRNKINKYEYEAITNSMNKLENDLEVLEILKKYLGVGYEGKKQAILVTKWLLNDNQLTKEDFEKVKRWLENE